MHKQCSGRIVAKTDAKTDRKEEKIDRNVARTGVTRARTVIMTACAKAPKTLVTDVAPTRREKAITGEQEARTISASDKLIAPDLSKVITKVTIETDATIEAIAIVAVTKK